MILDFLFIAVLNFGLAGAALATVCGECIGGLIPIFYFSRNNSSKLKLGKTHFNLKILIKTCTNGSSELMTNLSSSIVNSIYNYQLMKFAGENGVAAYGTIMYVNFIFIAIFLGYSIGSAPIISFHYGAKNDNELKNLFKKSISSYWLMGYYVICNRTINCRTSCQLFVGYNADLFLMTKHGFQIFCFAF